MARRQAPTTCTEADDCTHDTHVRTHDRSPTVQTKPHPDAPVVEAVCHIHGVVYSR